MSIRNLQYFFAPRSVALIGASRRPGSVGAALSRNLFRTGFDGPIMPVNPRHDAIEGVLTYPDIDSLPLVPDLAVISTPPDAVLPSVQALARRGTRAAIIITAGFEEAGAEGEARQAILDASRPSVMRIVGPNCLGIVSPRTALNASFAHLTPKPGRLAFVTQSGAIVTAVIGWAENRSIGFSHLVSLGDMIDVDFGDMLDFLANDAETRAILLYVEQVTSPRKFMSAARAAARMKPVIVVKGGRHAESAKAVASHTGSMAGNDLVYDAVFRRSGMLRVDGLDELFEAAEILAMAPQPRGDRVAVLTNGGGMGVLASDALLERGGRLAPLSDETMRTLNKVLPGTWSHGNPVDVLGDAGGERYRGAMEAILADRNVDAVIALHCPTAVGNAEEAAEAIGDVVARHKSAHSIPVLTSWVGETLSDGRRNHLAAQGVPAYETPEQAVRALMYMVTYRRNQESLMETPSSVPEAFEADTARARRVIEGVLADGREWLSEAEAKEMLAAYAVPVVRTHTAKDPDAAAAIAAEMGVPVVLKIVSPDITHKSDVGGVVLNVVGPGAVRRAAASMLEEVHAARPEARIEGVSVQPMVHRPEAYELIVGVTEDAQFGPVILFGSGGTAAEVVGDRSLALPPLNMHLARELVSRTRIYQQLRGYRGQAAVNMDALALTLIKVAQLVSDIPEVAELDINPLLADSYGVVALDARIRAQAVTDDKRERLAIRPYPKVLEERIPTGDGRTLLLRPVVPEDERALQRAFSKLSPEEIRLRFFAPMKTLSHVTAARFTQIDYDREMALILTDEGIPGTTELYGVVSITTDPDNETAEYSVLVRGDMTGMGLGIVLMRRIIDYARSRGTRRIFGDVLKENRTMLKLTDVLGFRRENVDDDPNLVRVVLELTEEQKAKAAAG